MKIQVTRISCEIMNDDGKCNSSNFAEKIADLLINPLESLQVLQKEFLEFDVRVTDQKYQYLAAIIAIFYSISGCGKTKRKFLERFFEGKKSSNVDEKRLLLLVFRYVLKAPSKKSPLYERARVYARALQGEVEKQTDPIEIPEAIREAGGIEKLYALERERSRLEKDKGSESQPPWDDTEDDESDIHRDTKDRRHGNNEKSKDNKSEGDDGLSDRNNPRSAGRGEMNGLFDPRKDLSVSCGTEAEMLKVLESKADRMNIFVTLERREGKPLRLLMSQWIEC